ncbi:MAG: glycosyltransferase family 39 protein [Psychrobacter sp.]|nr:glycosyltransferase family 39 protein [Psychrobacter sp.]
MPNISNDTNITLELKSQTILIVFLTVYFIIWSVAPALLASSVPLDVSEGISWGSEWQWGYYKHPPLSSWILYSFYNLFGRIGPYLLSQLSVMATMVLVYFLACKLMSHQRALLASVLTLGVVYYSYPSLEFNHNVAQFPIWAGLSLLFYHCINDNRYRDWVAFGIVGGLGMLTKYSVIFLLLPMALYLIFPRQWRLLKSPKPWLSALIMLAVFSPHLYWLLEYDWLPFSYISSRAHDSNEVSAVSAHFSGLGFTFSQAVAHLPLLIMAVLSRKHLSISSTQFKAWLKPSQSFANLKSATAITSHDDAHHNLGLIYYLWLAPLILLIVLSLVLGLGLRDMWGMPMWSLSAIVLVSAIKSDAISALVPKLSRYLMIWLGLVTLLMITYLAFGQQIRGKPSRMDWPAQTLTAQAEQTWQSISTCPLDSVSGDRWLSALVVINSPDPWPSQMISGAAINSPWMSLERLQQKGTLVMHEPKDRMILPLLDSFANPSNNSNNDSSTTNFAANHAHKTAINQRFTLLHYSGTWQISWPKQPKATPLTIAWQAYVPPQCAKSQ